VRSVFIPAHCCTEPLTILIIPEMLKYGIEMQA